MHHQSTRLKTILPWKWIRYFHDRGWRNVHHARLPWKWIHYFHTRKWLNVNHLCLQSKLTSLSSAVVIIVCSVMMSLSVSVHHAQSDPLNYRLKWLFNTSVAGDIYADAKGIFKAHGLTVNVKEGSPEKNAIKELELGYADFGVASADQVIRALDKGARVYVIAQLFQVNPMQWIYRENLPKMTTQPFRIENLKDLKGRHIGITFGGNDETIMNTLLAKGGIDKKDVTLTGVRFDFTPFLKKEVDIWPVYRNSQGVILQDKLQKAGETVAFFNPADFDVRFVANSVVTSEKMLKNKPDTVKSFTQALMEGWEAAMDPKNESVTLGVVKSLDKGTHDDIRQKQLTVTRGLIKPSPDFKIGTIDIDAWKQTEAIMLAENQIKSPVRVEKHLLPLE